MKIDISKIEGYDTMSAEEKLAALEGLDLPDPDYSGYVRKDVFDKTASELAAKKKELREKLSEDEVTKLKEQEEREKLKADYDALLHKVNVSETATKLIATGYDEALAVETAEAMITGDLAKVLANQKKHLETVEKNIRAEVLKGTPKPTPDGDPKQITKETLASMSPAERFRFSEEHPDEYRNLYSDSTT